MQRQNTNRTPHAQVATDTNKHLQYMDRTQSHPHDDGKVVRPVSAPARRSKPTTYPTALRDRVHQTSSESEEIVFHRSHEPPKSSPSTSRGDGNDAYPDPVEFNRIKALLEEEVRTHPHPCSWHSLESGTAATDHSFCVSRYNSARRTRL